MNTITINPLWIEFGGPALVAGLLLGGLFTWLRVRAQQRRLRETVAMLSDRLKDRDRFPILAVCWTNLMLAVVPGVW